MSETRSAFPARGAPTARLARLRVGWSWIGMVPFFAFAAAFLVAPTIYLAVGSLRDKQGGFTLQNYADLSQEQTITAYLTSIEISLVTAVAGGIFGFLLAYAVISGGLPRPIRSAVMTFSGVASNFAGVPLALAFTFTIGRAGLFTGLLKTLGIDVYDAGFSLYGKIGLEIVYLYFQLPLMVLIIAPAIDGLRRDWREAAENMGASTFQYWRHVAAPILAPSIIGSVILLFGNAFGAQATAQMLTGGQIPLVTLLIGRQIQGDVLHNPALGYALAMGMVGIMGVTIVAYSWLQRQAERWQRS